MFKKINKTKANNNDITNVLIKPGLTEWKCQFCSVNEFQGSSQTWPKLLFLLLTMLWVDSADNKLIFFSPRKWILTLHANCLLMRQSTWSVKSYFLGKIRKNISKCCLLIFLFTQHAKYNMIMVLIGSCLEKIIFFKQTKYTVFDLITAHTPISEQSRNSVVFRLQPVYFFLYFFTKAYVVGTHLNCIDKWMQFKWVPTTYAFVKKVRKNRIVIIK